MFLIKNMIYRIRGYQTLESLKKTGLVFGKGFNPQFPFFLDPSHCWLITIGDNVTFGPNVSIFAHDASTCNQLGYAKIGRVSIGNNVFIGAGSIVLPGVTIGENCIVGAGSVVSRSIPDNKVCAGNPAKIISDIEDFKRRNFELFKQRPKYGEEYTVRENIDKTKKEKQKKELSDGIGFVK